MASLDNGDIDKRYEGPGPLRVVMVHVSGRIVEKYSLVAARAERLRVLWKHTGSSSEVPGPSLMVPERTTSLPRVLCAPLRLPTA